MRVRNERGTMGHNELALPDDERAGIEQPETSQDRLDQLSGQAQAPPGGLIEDVGGLPSFQYRRLIPGPGEVVFAVVLTLVLAGGRHALFSDPGTLWHLRLGRDIVATGTLPHCDTLTFSRAGTPWVDQSWGFDVLLALAVDHLGWSAVVAITAIILGAVYAALASGLVQDGISPVVAVVVALLMGSIGSIHFLIRPHIITFVFVYLALRACQKQHENGGWVVAWVPVFTAILANLHGGFVALPVIVATAGLGEALSGPWDDARRRNTSRFLVALAASVLAGLLNPYGWDLYRNIGKLLVSSGVTNLISEFQPAQFGKPEARVLELVVLALLGLSSVSSRRVERYHMVMLLVWLHLALTSIRFAPLFALAAAGPLASLVAGLSFTIWPGWKGHGRRSLWIPILVTGIVILVALGVPLGGFDQSRWPFAALPTVNRQPVSARLFHEQDWGGLIAAECRPIRATYVDDRFELYGQEMILEYADALTGGPAWDTLRDREGISLVWLRPDRGLAKRLLKERGWEVLYQDPVSVVFGSSNSLHRGSLSLAFPR